MSTGPSSRSSTVASTAASRGAILLPLAALLLLAAPRSTGAAVVEEIVAKVNNRIITRSEFEERGAYILQQIYREYSGPDLDQKLRDAQDSLLANMITELLLLERAEALLDLDKVRLNMIEEFRKQENIPSDEELDRLLKEQGMTRKDLEEQLLRVSVPQEIISYEVRRKIAVSDAEIKAYYAKNARKWESPAAVTFREIVLFYTNTTRPEVAIRAEGVVRELKGGADFEGLVSSGSESGTRASGGLLGPLPAADLHPTIARAAFALDPGEFSEVLDTGRSFHIIRLETKTEKIVQSIDAVRDSIQNAIRQEKYKPRYDRYLRRIWRESQIDIAPKFRQYLVASPLTVPIPDAGTVAPATQP